MSMIQTNINHNVLDHF